MPNYNPPVPSGLFHSDHGNAVTFTDSVVVAANLGVTDKVRLCRIPAGTKVSHVAIRNPDLDSGVNLAVNIGFSHVDGSALAQSTALAAAATTWQAAATTMYEVLPPITLEKDAFLEAVPTVAGIGTGTIHSRVNGESMGLK